MTSGSYEQVLAQLLERFSMPGEDGARSLLELLHNAIEAIPQAVPMSPYLGQPASDTDWLAAFEDIPVNPRPAVTALRAAIRSFDGQIKWHEPAALHNITPPVLLETAAVSALAALFNGNCLWDLVSGGVLDVEQQVVRQMSRLAGWPEGTDGAFVFGGKGGLLYAIRLGLNRAVPGIAESGLAGCARAPVVVATAATHYSVETAASLAGLGTRAVRRAKVHLDATVDIEDLERVLTCTLESGAPIAAIILSGGDTLHNGMDAAKPIAQRVEVLSRTYALPYRPWIHYDAVLGWPWLFFRDHPFEDNPLGLGEEALRIIRHAAGRIAQIHVADSFAVDFHKDGLTPYCSSLFLAKDGAELHSLYRRDVRRLDRGPYGENLTQHHTIEHSRPCGSVLAAWTALQCFGQLGFQAYVANQTEVAVVFRSELPSAGFEVLNPWSKGFCTMVWSACPAGPRTIAKLLESDGSAIDAANRYNQAFYRHLAGLDGRRSGQLYVLGYIPAYVRAANDAPVGAIRVYPMSPHIDRSQARRMVEEFGRARESFDKHFEGREAPGVKVQQVPR